MVIDMEMEIIQEECAEVADLEEGLILVKKYRELINIRIIIDLAENTLEEARKKSSQKNY